MGATGFQDKECRDSWSAAAKTSCRRGGWWISRFTNQDRNGEAGMCWRLTANHATRDILSRSECDICLVGVVASRSRLEVN
jgi:hypothetical protein